jgi:hypothetical protein
MRVVVLGGAGNFGARIVRALQAEPTMELIAAGRRALPVPGAVRVRSVVLDVRAADFPTRLAALAPQLVIHCVGPFQGQGYQVVDAALASGAHYLDLADGREFVVGFAAAVDASARRAGKVAISGASTLPTLSSAVVEALRRGLSYIESVDIAIAPGQRAPRGTATLVAVFSYLGRPMRVWCAGQWQTVWGWMDLTLLPARYPELASVRFHAALEFGVQHFALWALAGLRRIGLLLPVERWAGVMNRIAGLFNPLGGEWGGMRVSVVGVTVAGARVRRTWQLTAQALHGPEIPTFAAILLARRLACGEALAAGAFACVGFLNLSEFEPEFARWGIGTEIEEGRA